MEIEKDNCSLEKFSEYLREREKSANTIAKYRRDVSSFLRFVGMKDWGREQILLYKEYLKENYKISSANSMLIALNCYLRYLGRQELCVQTYRQQRQIFRDQEKELNREDYEKLVKTAERLGNRRLSCLMQTVGSTGIRIGELVYITVEAVNQRVVHINFKGKERVILIPQTLAKLLKQYCRESGIKTGSIFITKNGTPIDRRNVWAEMKRLCQKAGVQESRVFPHNLRHLFARCYYEQEKDLARLADILGHSSVETSRRYTMIGGLGAYLKKLELGLVVVNETKKKGGSMT